MPRMPAMATCWYCNSELPETAPYCPNCGHSQADHTSSPLFGVVDPVTGIWNSKFLNALVGQKLSIVSPKVQTTRSRILAVASGFRRR